MFSGSKPSKEFRRMPACLFRMQLEYTLAVGVKA